MSDMRMPGIDGAMLLAIVEQEWPATVRTMLTGYAADSDLDLVRCVLHQLLRKPCSVSVIREAIERHLDMRAETTTATES